MCDSHSNRERRLLILVALLALFVAALPIPVRAASSLTIGTTEALVNLDPADAETFSSWELLTHLYTGLTRQIPGTLKYELALAASHTISDDGLTHTFTIRPDAAFDDGTPITAQIFVSSIKRVLALNGRGGIAIRPYVKDVSVNAEGALVFTLINKVPYFDALVALTPYSPVNPANFPADSFNNAPDNLVSNGVYKVGKFDVGNSITLISNPAWKGAKPATPTITIQHFNLPADLREALKGHTVDIAWRGLPIEDMNAALQVKGIKQTSVPGLQAFYLLFDQTSLPYNDLVVRQGITYMVDRDQITSAGLRTTGVPLYTLLPPELTTAGTPAFPKFDLDQGKKVLETGGYSKYKRIESEFQVSRLLYGDLYLSASEIVANTLSREEAFRIGRFDTESKAFLKEINEGTFRFILVGWTPIVPHPDAILRPLVSSAGLFGAGAHYVNKPIDDLLERAASTSDPAAQMDLYNQVQMLALKDVAAIPVWQNQQQLLAWDTVGGIQIEPNFLLRYDLLTIQ